mmetsp:Transcript_33368/g.92117  ORF Transcript_33368/g.92117 Transcript_33368/m.92117 type:complete len:393 (-) Transcript_33368:110-1288(-)|eukprot:CAMPEP_0117556036 /NCGR_PEP_ID=MMETSP0784-20121206/51592_1 /TAXON_ID=39447 /ORGANISM="" /LENGTH=392 /DNA_ID=CAMNT_0005353279 /DNA_START=71 /DNA_END=1249 /DNA_ORIENTATION=+
MMVMCSPVLLPEPRRPPDPVRPHPVVLEDDESGDDWELAFLQAEDLDDLGFTLPPSGDAIGDSRRNYARWFEPKAHRRLARFEAKRRSVVSGQWNAIPKGNLKTLLRKGVPTEHRAEVWWSILGCDEAMRNSPSLFAKYRDEVLSHDVSDVIERDLQRTFPGHVKFMTAAGRAQLRNVLSAFAHHNPRVRYCQGLNFIAALLLILFLDEERAFWALTCVIDRLGIEDYYSEGMTLLRADIAVLSGVMAQKCPKVARVFRDYNVDLLSICSEWYITLFAKCLPMSTLLRVWDTLFFEGFKVLFRVALGVFKRAESNILECSCFDDVMERAKRWPWFMVEHNELLKASFAGVPALRRRDLIREREAAMHRIADEDEQRQKRLREHRRAQGVSAC